MFPGKATKNIVKPEYCLTSTSGLDLCKFHAAK